jgi:ribonuclease HI
LAATLPYQSSVASIEDAQDDIAWWRRFIVEYNGISAFIDPIPVEMRALGSTIFTDSSGKMCAGVWGDTWFWYTFTEHDNILVPDIHHKEMYAIVISCLTWASLLSGKTILIYCDNQSVVEVITNGRGRDTILMKLLRELWFCSATHSFQIVARHLPGVRNTLADALSRDKLREALSIRPSLDVLPIDAVLPTMTW